MRVFHSQSAADTHGSSVYSDPFSPNLPLANAVFDLHASFATAGSIDSSGHTAYVEPIDRTSVLIPRSAGNNAAGSDAAGRPSASAAQQTPIADLDSVPVPKRKFSPTSVNASTHGSAAQACETFHQSGVCANRSRGEVCNEHHTRTIIFRYCFPFLEIGRCTKKPTPDGIASAAGTPCGYPHWTARELEQRLTAAHASNNTGTGSGGGGGGGTTPTAAGGGGGGGAPRMLESRRRTGDGHKPEDAKVWRAAYRARVGH